MMKGSEQKKKRKQYWVFCLFLFIPMQSLAAEEDFPIPDSLRPAIQFWFGVYTEVDTESGFLHDTHNLAVVYQKLERNSDLIKSTREGIKDDLRVLATGKRTDLSSSQSKILSLWPENVSNERLDTAANNVRWQLGQSDRFAAGLKRSGAYREHIEEVVNGKGMPVELSVLPHVESSFHPGAYSSAAATGMWQFVRATATRFMQVDYVVDERLDPYIATEGAMSLLEFNYNVLGTWPLALTAYNHGANGMARAVKEMGTTDIGYIISEYKGSRFGFASRNFYPQFLAVLEVEARADEFFSAVQKDERPFFEEREMFAYVDATALANALGLELNILKRDNPALQPSVWSGTKMVPKGYTIKINRDDLSLDLASGFDAIPDVELHSEQKPDLSYVVRSGDSLSVIAERFSTSMSELVAINQLRDRNTIRIGQTLLLPQPSGVIPTLSAGTNSALEIPENGRYTVARGDSISIISERFKIPTDSLLALNDLNDQSLIFPGQELNLKLVPIPIPNNQTEKNLALGEDDNAAQERDSSAQIIEAREPLIVGLEGELARDLDGYGVGANNIIEVQANETLGHFADWLNLRSQDIRALNKLSYQESLLIGQDLSLDFSKVDINSFESKRRSFHRDLQADYFTKWSIENTEEYKIKRRDSLADLTRERSIPMWLFRQYNPEVDAARLQIDQVLVFPVVQRAKL